MVPRKYTTSPHHLLPLRSLPRGLYDITRDVIVGIARTYLTSHAVNNAATLLWRAAPAVMLSFTEPCLGIICACLAVMRPVLLVVSSALIRWPSKISATLLNRHASRTAGFSSGNVQSGGGDMELTLRLRANDPLGLPVVE